MSAGQVPKWDPSEVAGYVAAALTQASGEGDWPDDVTGNAFRLLTQDLGEFAESMVAAGRAGYWSPAKALERSFVERVEVLMGASVDQAVGKRYLDSVVAPPTPERPNRPAKKARPEDALSQFFSKTDMSEEDKSAFRASWLDLKNMASEWFVHPTAMGPLLSRTVREDSKDADTEWLLMIRQLAHACYFVVAAANPLGVTIPVEIVRALYAAAQCLEEAGNESAETLLAIHAAIASKAVARERGGGSP